MAETGNESGPKLPVLPYCPMLLYARRFFLEPNLNLSKEVCLGKKPILMWI